MDKRTMEDILVIAEDNFISLMAVAKEGLIKQHTAERAITHFREELFKL